MAKIAAAPGAGGGGHSDSYSPGFLLKTFSMSGGHILKHLFETDSKELWE